MKQMTKMAIKLLAVFFLIFISYIILAVHYWSVQDEGRLPPKTAVILYAVHENIVTSKMKPPKFLTTTKPATIAREEITIPVSDGGQLVSRIYYPKTDGPHPIILYYHGGAFMEGYGNINTHDNIVRLLSMRTNSVVIAVGYRLAPDYIFPTAVMDSYDALIWAYEHGHLYNGDRDRIAVVGDSAGGNIATAVALMAIEEKGPSLNGQVLLYPLTTFQDVPLPSREMYDSGYYLLSRNVMYRAREVYAPMEEMWMSPYLSPLHAKTVAGMPETMIITAEYDPLRDEGFAYSRKLVQNGVPVTHYHYEGVMHGFISFYEVTGEGKHGLEKIVTFLQTIFSEQRESDVKFIEEVVGAPSGFKAVREYMEAYAIAAYLTIMSWSN